MSLANLTALERVFDRVTVVITMFLGMAAAAGTAFIGV
jgi:hypothetical protein